MRTLHVITGDSAGGSLIRGLRDARRDDGVAIYSDDLSYGPIDPPSHQRREAWMGEHLGWEPTGRVAALEDTFWAPLLAWEGPRLLWTSRRSGRERAGYLEVLRRLGDRPFAVIDVGERPVTCVRRAAPAEPYEADTTGMIQPAAFLEPEVLARARPLAAAEREDLLAEWAHLRAEDAPLRVVEGGRLRSKPLDHWDPLLLAAAAGAAGEWRAPARVVGEVARGTWEAGDRADSLVLTARLGALIASGALEARGERSDWRGGEVRRAGTGGERCE